MLDFLKEIPPAYPIALVVAVGALAIKSLRKLIRSQTSGGFARIATALAEGKKERAELRSSMDLMAATVANLLDRVGSLDKLRETVAQLSTMGDDINMIKRRLDGLAQVQRRVRALENRIDQHVGSKSRTCKTVEHKLRRRVMRRK
jgi:hypothetical protein